MGGKRLLKLEAHLHPEQQDVTRSLDVLRSVSFGSPSGGNIPLKPLADISIESGPSQISHEALRRRVVVELNVRCRDWCRIDVRLDGEGNPYVLELNPLPGILPKPESNSCFPKAARAAGMDYDSLMNRVLEVACERYGIAP